MSASGGDDRRRRRARWDVFAEHLASVVSPNHDFQGFWRSLMRFAHEIGQNGDLIVYCGVALPDQVFANQDMLALFAGVHFLGLVCDGEDLRSRITARAGDYDGLMIDSERALAESVVDVVTGRGGRLSVEGIAHLRDDRVGRRMGASRADLVRPAADLSTSWMS